MKLAAIEAMWETEPAPAAFTAFGFPDQEARETHFAVHIPWVMGLIGTRSLDHRDPRHRRARASRPRPASATASRPTTRCRRSAPPAATAAVPERRARPSRTTASDSATRCCSSAMSTIRARPRPSRSPRPRCDTVPRGGAAVLDLPHHGRARHVLHPADGHLLRGSRRGASSTRYPLAAQGRGVRHPAALGRHRVRLDRRRVRPPALGDRRRAADRRRRLQPRRWHRAAHHRSASCRALHRADRHRDEADAEGHPQGPGTGRRRRKPTVSRETRRPPLRSKRP